MNAYKFSKTATEEQPDILQGKTEIEFLKSKFQKGCIFGLDNLMQSGCYKVMGWSFDFKEHLTRYWYQQEHGLYAAYAPNKTLLRKVVYGKIYEIR
jgi:hypothetical protein